jgi:hypothetical protein
MSLKMFPDGFQFVFTKTRSQAPKEKAILSPEGSWVKMPYVLILKSGMRR